MVMNLYQISESNKDNSQIMEMSKADIYMKPDYEVNEKPQNN